MALVKSFTKPNSTGDYWVIASRRIAIDGSMLAELQLWLNESTFENRATNGARPIHIEQVIVPARTLAGTTTLADLETAIETIALNAKPHLSGGTRVPTIGLGLAGGDAEIK